MKKIPLTQGKFAFVDDDDYERLSRYTWYAYRNHKTFYAATRTPSSLQMHRVIMNNPYGMMVDHKNMDGLDNRKKNLRVCSQSQNAQNSSKRIDNTSGIKGVSWATRDNRWKAQIRVNGKRIHLGYFISKHEAARAYCIAAKNYHGEFARTS